MNKWIFHKINTCLNGVKQTKLMMMLIFNFASVFHGKRFSLIKKKVKSNQQIRGKRSFWLSLFTILWLSRFLRLSPWGHTCTSRISSRTPSGILTSTCKIWGCTSQNFQKVIKVSSWSRHSPSQSNQVYSLRNMDIHRLSTLCSIVAAPAY